MATADRVVKESLSEEVTFEQQKEAGCVNNQKKNVPGRGQG